MLQWLVERMPLHLLLPVTMSRSQHLTLLRLSFGLRTLSRQHHLQLLEEDSQQWLQLQNQNIRLDLYNCM
jgi:hypothetical protein